MDGTLVDTEPFWIEAETDLVASFGGVWTHEDALSVVGSGLWESARLLQTHGVKLGVDEIVQNLTDTVMSRIRAEGAPYRPGALELLRELREAGIPTALVTMSIGPMASLVVDSLPFPGFDLLVTGDLVDKPKPHPESYLLAAARLGVNPADCVAFEDSPPGIRSAADAGTVAVGIPHAVAIPAHPDYILRETLAGLTLADVCALFAERRALTPENTL
ncbi:HAD family phosphatase [Mycetocola spongiae]|nr:HAD family phosphatase [Mycetocola spongiae]UCR90470.1 HAD family phosphatase [Mycetocola spongiae]